MNNADIKAAGAWVQVFDAGTPRPARAAILMIGDIVVSHHPNVTDPDLSRLRALAGSINDRMIVRAAYTKFERHSFEVDREVMFNLANLTAEKGRLEALPNTMLDRMRQVAERIVAATAAKMPGSTIRIEA